MKEFDGEEIKDLGGMTINIDGGIHVISTRLEKVQVKCDVGDEAKVITHTYGKGTRTKETVSPRNVGKYKQWHVSAIGSLQGRRL